ncbi:MAG: DUF2141 domain-containing protein [Cytophagaceae bacterium]
MTKHLFLLLLFFCSTTQGTHSTSGSELVIEVNGLRNNIGHVRLGLFNNSEKFLDVPYLKAVAEIKDKKAVIIFKNLKPGNYAVGLLHDENGNEEMDYNWVGIPKEGYGISNNTSMKLKKPSFQESSFEVKANQKKTVQVKMIYF